MKKESTIRQQMQELRRRAENPSIPANVQHEAYCMAEALSWVLDRSEVTPERFIIMGLPKEAVGGR